MTCPLQREQDKGPETAGISPVPPTKAGLGGRAWAGRGVWRRGELKPQSPGLSAAPAQKPPPPVLVPGQHFSLRMTPAQRQPSQAAPRCQGRKCQGDPPSAHGQVPCSLPPHGTRVQDKHLLIEGVALYVSKVEHRKDSERTQVRK